VTNSVPDLLSALAKRANGRWQTRLPIYGALTLAIVAVLHLLKGVPALDPSEIVSTAIGTVVLAGIAALLGAAFAAIIRYLFRVRRRFGTLWWIASLAVLILVGGLMLIQA